ncbi:hypothetical protein M3Y97_00453500 [Aphelenchoides bicaudatus]|nr:hypothetical protein M3Y97_00453500 [Aphelenchoides bicaudatus]
MRFLVRFLAHTVLGENTLLEFNRCAFWFVFLAHTVLGEHNCSFLATITYGFKNSATVKDRIGFSVELRKRMLENAYSAVYPNRFPKWLGNMTIDEISALDTYLKMCAKSQVSKLAIENPAYLKLKKERKAEYDKERYEEKKA